MKRLPILLAAALATVAMSAPGAAAKTAGRLTSIQVTASETTTFKAANIKVRIDYAIFNSSTGRFARTDNLEFLMSDYTPGMKITAPSGTFIGSEVHLQIRHYLNGWHNDVLGTFDLGSQGNPGKVDLRIGQTTSLKHVSLIGSTPVLEGNNIGTEDWLDKCAKGLAGTGSSSQAPSGQAVSQTSKSEASARTCTRNELVDVRTLTVTHFDMAGDAEDEVTVHYDIYDTKTGKWKRSESAAAALNGYAKSTNIEMGVYPGEGIYSQAMVEVSSRDGGSPWTVSFDGLVDFQAMEQMSTLVLSLSGGVRSGGVKVSPDPSIPNHVWPVGARTGSYRRTYSDPEPFYNPYHTIASHQNVVQSQLTYKHSLYVEHRGKNSDTQTEVTVYLDVYDPNGQWLYHKVEVLVLSGSTATGNMQLVPQANYYAFARPYIRVRTRTASSPWTVVCDEIFDLRVDDIGTVKLSLAGNASTGDVRIDDTSAVPNSIFPVKGVRPSSTSTRNRTNQRNTFRR